MKTYKIGDSIKYIAWGGFLLSAMAIAGQILDPKSGAIIISIVFGAASLYLHQLSKSSLTITEICIILTLALGTPKNYLIPWNEVQSIHTDGRSYILSGNDKALTFSTFMTSRQEKKKILEELEVYVKKHNIQVLWQPEIITKLKNTEVPNHKTIH
jgi:hypothetical protein